MNKQIAIGLIVGSVLALFPLYSGIRYFDNNTEITKSRYLYLKEEMRRTDKDWNINYKISGNTLVFLVFAGGFGVGYLFSERIEKKDLNKKNRV